ncbi:MAG TPA: hypothetical protein VIB49_04165 [Thermoplasmata archaeon]
MRRNDESALLAVVSGILLILSGYTGARSVNGFFEFLEEVLGPRPFLLVLAYVFVGIASLGGLTVLIGGYLIWRDRVRLGRILILIGSGAGLFTLLVFLLVNTRREAFSFLASVLPAILGVFLGILARVRAKAKPIL